MLYRCGTRADVFYYLELIMSRCTVVQQRLILFINSTKLILLYRCKQKTNFQFLISVERRKHCSY